MKDFLEDNDLEDKGVSDEHVEAEDEADEEIEEEQQQTWNGSIADMNLFDLIETDSFVAIRAETGSMELFHLVKVEEKKIAAENIQDFSGEQCVERRTILSW